MSWSAAVGAVEASVRSTVAATLGCEELARGRPRHRNQRAARRRSSHRHDASSAFAGGFTRMWSSAEGLRVDGASARVFGLRRCFRKDGQQDTTRIADLERAAPPLRVARLRLERDAGVLRAVRYLVDAARRRDRQAHAIGRTTEGTRRWFTRRWMRDATSSRMPGLPLLGCTR
jgi:hypothetical protein